MSSTNLNNTDLSQLFETTTARLGKFILFVTLEPPALLCNLFLVYHLVADRTLRRALHTHVVLVLLIVSLLTNAVEVPRVLAFLHQVLVLPATVINCLIWQWCDFSLCSLNNMLMWWMSIERYLLVFHSRIFNTSKYRWLLHYLPLTALVIYITGFYVIVIFLYPCEPQPNYLAVLCGLPCFSLEVAISIFDLIAHNLAPLIFNVFLSIAIIIRVVYMKKFQIHQPIHWKKYRKMILQLLILSFLYSMTVAPYALIPFVGLFGGLPTVAAYMQTVYFYYLFWLLMLLLPLVCIVSINEVKVKITKPFTRLIGRGNTVTPLTMTLIHNQTLQLARTVYHTKSIANNNM
ncbi:unnamed protein product [Rotaria magnacalcarata]|uniref:G-protein coupled receptors family 1 profile domain-containing protein n=1 Tax=Rotaria magnacalcarata TaxID=392030 RepID=A0A816FV92_9BILA|nr:unnamed protein product [Rotaria magnacalcarata]CAF1666068.1 unnamed protein product [Rotaria magnacalcarata]CAF3960088.1 unnamed protein product [Rotaria magnacalcarata]CAF3994767.1 unnamed protein product [Rotaria magnacalcarata]